MWIILITEKDKFRCLDYGASHKDKNTTAIRKILFDFNQDLEWVDKSKVNGSAFTANFFFNCTETTTVV